MNRRISAFSLIELLIVAGIMIIVMGMSLHLMHGDTRRWEVERQANLLAQTLRQAREMAIKEGKPVAVTFNIANAPGTSGAVINNWSGGHWYRIVGSISLDFSAMLQGLPWTPCGSLARISRVWPPGVDIDVPITSFEQLVRGAYRGEQMTLPAHQVRFLALNDQDNGPSTWDYGSGTGQFTYFGPSYPRPWFGSWDPTTNRLKGWGCYDPTWPTTINATKLFRNSVTGGYLSTNFLVNNNPMNPTGFYYEGFDGPITGCVNSFNRWIATDSNGQDGLFVSTPVGGNAILPSDRDGGGTATFNTLLFTAGASRPLIHGEWMDRDIVFWPDGSAHEDSFLDTRHSYSQQMDYGSAYFTMPANKAPLNNGTKPDGSGTGPWSLTSLGPGDCCNQTTQWGNFVQTATNLGNLGGYYSPFFNGWKTHEAGNAFAEARSFMYEPGFSWTWITLAPDMTADGDTFANAGAAYESLMPAFRVGVSRFGEVKVVQVGRTMPASIANTWVLDSELTGSNWDNATFVQSRYWNNRRTNTDTAHTPEGITADTFLTQDMLTNRTFWLLPKP